MVRRWLVLAALLVAGGRPASSRRGMTLLELLIALAIILLLGSLVYPALGQAKARARQAACTSNLRQVGQAVQLYVADYNQLPAYMWQLAGTALSSPEVLVCPSDALLQPYGYGEAFERVWRAPAVWSDTTRSYLYWRVGGLRNLERLVTRQRTAGYVLCVLHGTQVVPASPGPVASARYQGRFLRLRPDGSVKRVEAWWEPKRHSCTARYFQGEPCALERGELPSRAPR